MRSDPDRLYGGGTALRAVVLALRLACALALTLVALAPAAPAQPARGGNAASEVRIPFPRDDGTLTPYTFELGYPLMTLVYDTLLWRGRGGQPEYWLIRSLRKSDAGRRITLRLRDDVAWHDGQALTADDVAFTFDYFLERFHPRFTPQLEAVEDARAVGPRTVEIALSHPSPGFEDQPLSDMPILPRHLWEDLPAGEVAPEGLPVGTGPYRLVEHRRGTRYRFRATRGYFRGPPRVQTITVPFIDSFAPTLRELENRDVDMIPVTLPPPAQEEVRRSVFEVSFGDLYTGTVLMFNLRQPLFDDPAARRAVSAALDLGRLTTTSAGRDGVPADRGYLHPDSAFGSETRVQRLDEARARSELAELDLPPIRIMAPEEDPVRSEAGRQVALALERAGATAGVEEVPQEELADAVGQDGSEPDFDAAIWASPPLASYDPDFLRVVFGSGSAPLNYSGYASEEFDRLAAITASTTNPETRRQTVQSELELLAEDAPVVPLFFPEGAFAFRPQIYEGWLFVQGTGILDKRSFLRRTIPPDARGADRAVPTGAAGGGIGVLGIVALVVVGMAVALLGLGLTGRLGRR